MARAFCSQVESLGVARMPLKQSIRAAARFHPVARRSDGPALFFDPGIGERTVLRGVISSLDRFSPDRPRGRGGAAPAARSGRDEDG